MQKSKKILIATTITALNMSMPVMASTLDINVTGPSDSGNWTENDAAISLAQTFSPGFDMKLDAVQINVWVNLAGYPVKLSIYQANAIDDPLGSFIGATTVTPIDGENKVDFSTLGITLNSDKLYSLVLTSDYAGNPINSNGIKFDPGWAPSRGLTTPNSYPKGMLLTNEFGTWKPFKSSYQFSPTISDLVFKTFGTPISSVPEPSSALQILSGLMLGFAIYRNRSNIYKKTTQGPASGIKCITPNLYATAKPVRLD